MSDANDWRAQALERARRLIAATAPVADAEAGMEKMSEVYNETGRELYIGANGREHD